MQRKNKTFKNYSQISATLLLFAFGVGCSSTVDTEQSAQQKKLSTDKPNSAITKSTVKSPMAAGMKIYRDPETGEFLSSPPEGDLGIPQQDVTLGSEANSFSDEGLETVTHPDGSVSVDLQGRFQSEIHATMDKNGKITVNHKPGGADAAHKPQAVKP